jgi:hypothetical protein
LWSYDLQGHVLSSGLFTQVRGIEILGSSLAGSCIAPPRDP